MVHSLKTQQPFFEQLWRGEKTFELRRDDRAYTVGDVLSLQEWHPQAGYGARRIKAEITSVMRRGDLRHLGPTGLAGGWVVLSLKVVSFDCEAVQ